MIEQWLERKIGNVKHTSKELTVCCPFCNDTKYHMYINTTKLVVHCQRCKWSGSVLTLVREVSGAESYAEVYKQLKEPSYSISSYTTIVAKLAEKRAKLNAAKQAPEMPNWFKSFSAGIDDARAELIFKYALIRLPYEKLEHYNFGYCTTLDQELLTMRMIIPVERNYWQARAITKLASQRYINPSTPVEDRLFNYKALQLEEVYIAEGAISAIAIGLNAIATLGNNGANPAQKERLAKSKVRKFTIAYDAGQEIADRVLGLADYLSGYDKDVFIRKYHEGDPDEGGEYEEYEFNSKTKLESLFKNRLSKQSKYR